MDYTPIIEKLRYWREYCGSGENYRKAHDLDCLLTHGNLSADTLCSLWLPLRYSLNYFESERWSYWKKFEENNLRPQKLGLKDYNPFLLELERDIEQFLPHHETTRKLIRLFELGQRRCNVMLLPERSWNTKRGRAPYYDYLPHFLYDLLSSEYNAEYNVDVSAWIKTESIDMFFKDNDISCKNIIDLAGTGDVRRHPPKDIDLPYLLENYIRILELREVALGLSA